MAGILALPNMLVTPCGALLESTELNFRNLFLHQILNVNQGKIVDSNDQVRMGETAVNNWAIYDGEDRRAVKVASAKGMHMKVDEANHWCCSLVIVFDGEKFTGSTLQVMGVDISDETSEWGIIGGTGEFAMARGVIKREESNVRPIGGSGKVQKLTLHAFCVPRSFPDPEEKKQGAWPVPAQQYNGDYNADLPLPRRLLSVTIHCGFVADALEFKFIDQTGKEQTLGPWGGSGGHKEEITLGDSEFIRNISGTSDMINGRTIVTSLRIHTSKGKDNEEELKEYGPFGREQGQSFGSSLMTPNYVFAFFGNYSPKYLESIGVYYA